MAAITLTVSGPVATRILAAFDAGGPGNIIVETPADIETIRAFLALQLKQYTRETEKRIAREAINPADVEIT